MTNSKDACFLEEFLCDHEFPPAIYDEIHALNNRWKKDHRVTNCNEFNRKLLFSALDSNLVKFLEGKNVSVLLRKENDYVRHYYRFKSHDVATEDSGSLLSVSSDNLTPDLFIGLLISVMDWFNGD